MTTIKDLELAAVQGRIDRRDFVKQATALGLTAAAAGTLADRSALAADGPLKGGTFRLALDDGNTTDSMDPATYEGTFQIISGRTFGNFLTENTPDNKIGPDVAEGWEASADATEWVFELKKGVEFHNGKDFTAEDAVASLNYHRGEASTSGGKSLLDAVVDIKADGDHAVKITLSGGSADLPYVMSDYHFVMLPSDGEGNVDTSGIGTGPYVLKDFEPGIEAVWERNPSYFKDGKANFEAVEYYAVQDANARQTGLTTGQFDAIIEIDVKTVEFFAQSPGVVVEEVPSGTHVTLPMFVDVAPFDNNDVRMALKLAMDRRGALDLILRGHGTVGNDQPIAPVLPYYDANLEQREYDPDKAKWHLKQAGMENLAVSFSTSDIPFPGGVDLAVFYQESAKMAGIDIDVVREAEDGYWSDVWLVKPFSLCAWGQRPTPDVMFSLGYAAGGPWNDTHFADPRFNELLIQARAELDDTLRAEMYAEMQMIMRDQGGTIIPFFRNWVFATSPNVQHAAQMSGDWTLDGLRGTERWWFADGTA